MKTIVFLFAALAAVASFDVVSRQGMKWIVVKPTEHPDSIDDAVKSGNI